MQDEGAEAAQSAFFDGDQNLVLARQPRDETGVQGFGKSSVGDGGR